MQLSFKIVQRIAFGLIIGLFLTATVGPLADLATLLDQLLGCPIQRLGTCLQVLAEALQVGL